MLAPPPKTYLFSNPCVFFWGFLDLFTLDFYVSFSVSFGMRKSSQQPQEAQSSESIISQRESNKEIVSEASRGSIVRMDKFLKRI